MIPGVNLVPVYLFLVEKTLLLVDDFPQLLEISLWIIDKLLFPNAGREKPQAENQAETLLQYSINDRILHGAFLLIGSDSRWQGSAVLVADAEQVVYKSHHEYLRIRVCLNSVQFGLLKIAQIAEAHFGISDREVDR